MRLKSPPPVASDVKRENKVETLKAFLLPQIRAVDPNTIDATLTLFAVSAESPIARALVELAPEIMDRGLRVRAIFHSLHPESTPQGWTVSGPAIAFERDVRWARNPKLADGHEQVVLGAATAWIGDCLRRDGNRRDAYEQRVLDDAATVTMLRRGFERLWAISEPLLVRQLGEASPGAIATLVATVAAAEAEVVINPLDGDAPTPATRQ